MKILNKLSVLPLLFLGFAAQAQTETLASEPKKLQQLYMSVGTGPAVTTQKHSNPFGGAVMLNFTGAFGPSNIYRLHIQHSGFTGWLSTEPGPFDYLTMESYNSNFSPENDNTTVSILFGRKQKVNNLIQIQGFAGLGTNFISTYEVENREIIEGMRCGTQYSHYYVRPGVMLQAEAMFLPSKFAGLTLGAYTNIAPKLTSAGLNLNLNLGKLK